MGVGVLLLFFGVARVSTRLIPRLAVAHVADRALGASSSSRSSLWPFFTLPYWLLRYGAWGPGPVSARRIAGLCRSDAHQRPRSLVIVLLMWLRRAADDSGSPSGRWSSRASFPTGRRSRVGAENARRNPQRTASTAAALMIGLALVTLVATLAAGIVSSFTDAVNELFTGDYAITAQNNFSPIPIDAAEAAAKAPGVIAIGNVRTGEALVFGESRVRDRRRTPAWRRSSTWTGRKGRRRSSPSSGRTAMFVDDSFADDHDLKLGSTVEHDLRERDEEDLRGEGHLQSADRRLAVRRR